MQKRKKFALFVASLIVSYPCFALSVDELKRGLDQALSKGASATELSTYVIGYVHGGAEYGRTLGLVCAKAGLVSTTDELRVVRTYLNDHPEEWPDGAQLLINRALISPKCNH
jgi:hypothetical protein